MTIRQSGFLKDTVGTYILKDPRATLQYGIDWSEWLEPGDDIAASSWAVETTGTNLIVATTNGSLDGVALVSISSGTTGEIYTVRNTISTDQGYSDTRRFRIKVENRYIP
jgi:hypothetical protein